MKCNVFHVTLHTYIWYVNTMYYVVPSLCYKEGGTSCKFIHPLQYFAFFRVMNSSLVVLYSSFEFSFLG